MLKLQQYDNEHVRKRILKSKTINITTIPALLLVYNNGGVEKYDGQNVFNLIEALIQNIYLPHHHHRNHNFHRHHQNGTEAKPQAKAQESKNPRKGRFTTFSKS